MNNLNVADYSKFEQEMNEALRNVALEIRSVEILDLVSFIHAQNFANIGDIVSSASELYFKPGALQFSYSGDVILDWFGNPQISLDLELHEASVDIFFELRIDAYCTEIIFKHAEVNGRPMSVMEDLEVFQQALRQAKINRDVAWLGTLEWSKIFRSAVQ